MRNERHLYLIHHSSFRIHHFLMTMRKTCSLLCLLAILCVPVRAQQKATPATEDVPAPVEGDIGPAGREAR